MSYDKLGNICSKSINGSVHAYTYADRAGCGLGGVPGAVTGDMAGSPHQVLSIAGSALNSGFQYDGRGNQTMAEGIGRNIHYTQDDRA